MPRNGRVEHVCNILDSISWIINTSYQKLPFGSGDDPDKIPSLKNGVIGLVAFDFLVSA